MSLYVYIVLNWSVGAMLEQSYPLHRWEYLTFKTVLFIHDGV